ncbi:MAG: hypothetical protein E6Q97_03705 [Desulfurellales bacterium]|nr:MAG: hypothetical protein E6Q97_03705 [Desulfurellales bacterium]
MAKEKTEPAVLFVKPQSVSALEQVATGRAPNENSRVNWDIARGIARKALENAGWPLTNKG